MTNPLSLRGLFDLNQEKILFFFGALALYYYRIHSCYSWFIFFFFHSSSSSSSSSSSLSHNFQLLFCVYFFLFDCFSLFFLIDSLKPIKKKKLKNHSVLCFVVLPLPYSNDFFCLNAHTFNVFHPVGFCKFFSFCAQSVVIYRSADAHISVLDSNSKRNNRVHRPIKKQKEKQIEISSLFRAQNIAKP